MSLEIIHAECRRGIAQESEVHEARG